MTRHSETLPVILLLALASSLFLTWSGFGSGVTVLIVIALAAALHRSSWPQGRKRLISGVIGLGIGLGAYVVNGEAYSTTIALLLAVAGWLKLAEHSGPRDRFAALLAALFLIALSVMRQPANLAIGAIVLSFVLMLWSFARDQAGQGGLRAGRLAVQVSPALVLAVVLFVFTPRITGNLGLLAFALDLPLVIETATEAERQPQENSMPLDGLGESSDGDMRVLMAQFYKGTGRFENGVPKLGDLYWRGPVLWTYEDQKWQGRPGWGRRSTRLKSKLNSAKLDREIREAGNMSMYDVSLFPHRSEWLYALDLPAWAPPSSYVTRDWQLMNMNPVREVLHFAMMSYIDFRAGAELDAESRALALQLPDEAPRTQAMGRALAAQHGSDHRAIVLQGLETFSEGFGYTREHPKITGDDPIDAFMFDTKLGFGMQFATSYALMMRAAGVPTRVVSGYRGGTNMGLIERVLVLQRDAHAWTEVWLDDYGWVRMDPSAKTFANQHGENASGWGLASGLPEEDVEEEDDPVDAPTPEPARSDQPQMVLTQDMVDRADGQAHWLDSFDANTQGRMLEAGGLDANWRVLVSAGIAVLGLGAAALGLLRYLRVWHLRRSLPFSEQMSARFCDACAMFGPVRAPHESLRAYVARVVEGESVNQYEKERILTAYEWLREALYQEKHAEFPKQLHAFAGMSELEKRLVDKNTKI